MRLFWRNGYRNTSIQQLDKELSLHPGSLYGAFGNKRGLSLQALERYFEKSSRQMARRLEADSPLAGLRNLFARLIDDLLDCRTPVGCMMINTATELASEDEAIRQRLDEMFQSHEHQLRGALEAAKKCGELGPDVDSEGLARFLLMGMRGLRLHAQVRLRRSELEALVEQLLVPLG